MKPYDHRAAGRVLRRLRLRSGLSQETLSGLAGLARSHLAMIENGKKDPSVDTLWRLADALGLTSSELFRLVEEEIGGE